MFWDFKCSPFSLVPDQRVLGYRSPTVHVSVLALLNLAFGAGATRKNTQSQSRHGPTSYQYLFLDSYPPPSFSALYYTFRLGRPSVLALGNMR